MVCQLKVPIVSIVTSANQGAHVLIKVDAADAREWGAMRDMIKPTLTKLGMDGDAMKAQVYCRLPGAWRDGKVKSVVDDQGKAVVDGKVWKVSKFVPFEDGRRVQQLLYFNPRPLSLLEFGDGKPGTCIGEGATYSHG